MINQPTQYEQSGKWENQKDKTSSTKVISVVYHMNMTNNRDNLSEIQKSNQYQGLIYVNKHIVFNKTLYEPDEYS